MHFKSTIAVAEIEQTCALIRRRGSDDWTRQPVSPDPLFFFGGETLGFVSSSEGRMT